MREALALVRQDFLTGISYRVRMIFSLTGLMLSLVPLYFVAQALQPVMAPSIASQGGEYFTFVLLGMIALNWVMAALNALADALATGVRTGTLESLFATPVSLTAVAVGLTGYRLVWTAAESAVLIAFGSLLGARFAAGHVLTGALILMLIVAAYLGIGMAAAALIVRFRTSGPLLNVVLVGSTLLGGVYFPTHVIPSWIQQLSAVVPLTYGLRALRRSLHGAAFTAVSRDVATLSVMAVLSLGVGLYALHQSLRQARRSGSLAQY